MRRPGSRSSRPWRRERRDVARLDPPLLGPRVMLRPFEDDDAAAMLDVYGDREVMQFVGHGAVRSIDGVRAMLHQYTLHQRNHGFAFWAVVDRESGVVIGDGGLARAASGELEMGYTLARQAWGRGLGTEVASIWTGVAFGQLGAASLRALVEPENMRSRRVLEGLGFVHDSQTMAFGRPHLVYRAWNAPDAGAATR